MIEFLFDADAFLCIRTLSLLRALEGGPSRWIMTEWIARRELSTVATEIESLRTANQLRVEGSAARGSAQSKKYWDFVKRGEDKGEAEAVAWASELPSAGRPMFISNDLRARRLAQAHKVPTGDIMDLVVVAVQNGLVTRERAKEILAVWQDKRQSICRPSDFTAFDAAFSVRAARLNGG